ncbi:SIR2 family protein [Arthrobacter sp. TMN-49]
MWITGGVNLPQAVLDEQAAGRLVLFVGAGASVDRPSGLPLFDKLASQLAEMARVPFDKDAAIDFFLGSMPEGFDTHRHARDIVTRADSAPNATHAALVRVASSHGQLRIVTTNFDDHLSTAATADGITVSDTWVGPALPLGGDFTGIVHLHGSVLREPQELVLDDRDFGRAYLTNAWATRFLLPMFQGFTVLFVGYSHDDPIMRYLALGLPSGTPRYAFTTVDEAKISKWVRLGIQTIGYPVKGHDHSALVAALEAWNLRARMGQTDHHARIVEVVKGGPSLTPVDHDYLVSQLNTASGAREFVRAVNAAESAQQVEWLLWIEDLPEFKVIFNGQNGNATANVLGSWFCQSFIAVPELHGAALQTVQRLGQSLGKELFRDACWAAGELFKADGDAGRRWKVLLATSVYGHSAPVASESLLPYEPAERPEDTTVLRAVLRPYLVLQRRWNFGGAEELTPIPEAEVHWTTGEGSLTGHVLKAVEFSAPGDSMLGTLLEGSLNEAYELLEAYHGQRTWDPLSSRRSAIEPHEQDEFRDPVDAVIDGLREYGAKNRLARPDLPERWWSLDRVLFKRLALHLVALDTSRSPDEKISWLLERAALYEYDLKHEVYGVLKVAAETATSDARDSLLKAAQAGPALSEALPDFDRHFDYSTYNLLVWLTQVAPEWAEAVAAKEEVQSANTDFAPRDNPDFDMWSSSGTWGGKLPMEPEAFIASIEDDVSAAMDDLLSKDYSERKFGEPEWRDALSLVNQVVESRPEIGESIWSFIDGRVELGAQTKDLRGAVIEGWAKAPADGIGDSIVARVATQIPSIESARSISRFLLEQARKRIESVEVPANVAMRRMALDLWTAHGQSFTHYAEFDPNSSAALYLNCWPGDLAQYWLVEVDRRWRKDRDNWSGLSLEEHEALNQLLDGPPHALHATQPALASQLFFLFGADPVFATERVIPLFGEEETAALVWNSYLYGPRYNDKMLEAGMLDATIEEWKRLSELSGGTHQNQFFSLVTSIISFAGITPESRQKMLDESVLAAGGEFEAEFAQAVVRFIRADAKVGSKLWNTWLRDHLSARMNGVPRTLANEVFICWVEIVPYLGDEIPEATKLLANRGIGLGLRPVQRDIPESALSAHAEILALHYAERIRNSAPSHYVVTHQVKKLIGILRSKLGDDGVEVLIQAATERGIISSSGE